MFKQDKYVMLCGEYFLVPSDTKTICVTESLAVYTTSVEYLFIKSCNNPTDTDPAAKFLLQGETIGMVDEFKNNKFNKALYHKIEYYGKTIFTPQEYNYMATNILGEIVLFKDMPSYNRTSDLWYDKKYLNGSLAVEPLNVKCSNLAGSLMYIGVL